VEVSKYAAAYGNKHGLNIFNGELNDAKFPSNFFDVIVMNHVLEHLFNPKETLQEVSRILKPDGLLIIGIPNIDSYAARVFGKYWSAMEIPRHLYHFSVKTLKLLLSENNFEIDIIKSKTYFIPHLNKESIFVVKKENGNFRFVSVCLRIYLLKHIFFFLSLFSRIKRQEFGEIVTVYCYKRFLNKTVFSS